MNRRSRGDAGPCADTLPAVDGRMAAGLSFMHHGRPGWRRIRRYAACAAVAAGLALLGPDPRRERQRCRGRRGVRADRGAGRRAAAHAVAARLGGRHAAGRGVLQRRAGEPGRQHEVGLEEHHLAARRHRRRPRTPRRRRHRRPLLPRPRRRPREARHHRRGPADHAVRPRDHQQPELRALGGEPSLGPPRPDAAPGGRAGHADDLQHRQHPPAVGDRRRRRPA